MSQSVDDDKKTFVHIQRTKFIDEGSSLLLLSKFTDDFGRIMIVLSQWKRFHQIFFLESNENKVKFELRLSSMRMIAKREASIRKALDNSGLK